MVGRGGEVEGSKGRWRAGDVPNEVIGFVAEEAERRDILVVQLYKRNRKLRNVRGGEKEEKGVGGSK